MTRSTPLRLNAASNASSLPANEPVWVVAANLAASRAADDACGLAYNIAAGRRVTLLELLEMLSRLVGVSIPPRHDPPRPGDVKHSQADAALAARHLGWKAQVGMEEGLRRLVEAFERSSDAQ